MIDVKDLSKWYGPTRAIDRLSFQIPAGQVVGFLGPNGAGKTTTLRILTGYLPPTSGLAVIDGHNVLTQAEQARGRIGYLPESTPLYPEMRVEEYLDFRGKLYGMDRSNRKTRIGIVCERCGLANVKRRLIGQLSKGNKQCVGLAQALLHDPPVLVLDEPTAGLDPNQTGEFRKLLAELRGRHTVILSTHILSEVERTADRVMIIARGEIRYDQMVSRAYRVIVEAKAAHEALQRAIAALPGVKKVDVSETNGWTRAHVTAEETATETRDAIGQIMLNNRWQMRERSVETAVLERYFSEVTAGAAPSAAAPASDALQAAR